MTISSPTSINFSVSAGFFISLNASLFANVSISINLPSTSANIFTSTKLFESVDVFTFINSSISTGLVFFPTTDLKVQVIEDITISSYIRKLFISIDNRTALPYIKDKIYFLAIYRFLILTKVGSIY